jgi:hypothetical protein
LETTRRPPLKEELFGNLGFSNTVEARKFRGVALIVTTRIASRLQRRELFGESLDEICSG